MACDPGSNDDGGNCQELAYVGAASVSGPDTASPNETVSYTLNFLVDNSCGSFNSVSEEANGAYEKTLTILVLYDGCNCSAGQFPRTGTYSFTPTIANTYTLKFRVTESTFITKTLVVN